MAVCSIGTLSGLIPLALVTGRTRAGGVLPVTSRAELGYPVNLSSHLPLSGKDVGIPGACVVSVRSRVSSLMDACALTSVVLHYKQRTTARKKS